MDQIMNWVINHEHFKASEMSHFKVILTKWSGFMFFSVCSTLNHSASLIYVFP